MIIKTENAIFIRTQCAVMFIPDVNMIEIISDHIATSKSLKNATKDEIKSLGVEGHQALHATLSTMTELKTVARMLTRGQLRVNMELVGSEEPPCFLKFCLALNSYKFSI